MFLLIGLGNPGEKYTNTRHNVGFFVLDQMREELSLPEFKQEEKFKSKISKNTNYLLAKPQTFMNNSGEAVRLLANYYKIEPKKIIIIHDDKDIPLGEFRLQADRSSAGHNGVQSIIDHLKTQDFTRLRIGIKTETSEKIPTEKFVLQCFLSEEKTLLQTAITDAKEELLKSIK